MSGTDIKHRIERKFLGNIIEEYIEKIKNGHAPDLVYRNIFERFSKYINNSKTKDKIQMAMEDSDSEIFQLATDIIKRLDTKVCKTFLLNIIYEGYFRGKHLIQKSRIKPISNHGFLSTYINKHDIDAEGLDNIVSKGEDRGIFMYILALGADFFRDREILGLLGRHEESCFMVYTNPSKINDSLCKYVLELGNIGFLFNYDNTFDEQKVELRGKEEAGLLKNGLELLWNSKIIYGFVRDLGKRNVSLHFVLNSPAYENGSIRLEEIPNISDKRLFTSDNHYIISLEGYDKCIRNLELYKDNSINVNGIGVSL